MYPVAHRLHRVAYPALEGQFTHVFSLVFSTFHYLALQLFRISKIVSRRLLRHKLAMADGTHSFPSFEGHG
jgi:hypothetical protein